MPSSARPEHQRHSPSASVPPAPELPAVDARLVAPGTRYEISEGRVVYVAPSDEEHGTRHSKAAALFEAHAADEYDVACDMLTRTSELGDMAPDVSVFPRARDPETGGRQLEQIAVEIVSTQSLTKAGAKAHELARRGVRRVFAIDTERSRAFEWSRDLGTWEILPVDALVTDPCLAAPLPVAALLNAAKADDTIAQALLAKNNPVLRASLASEHAEGKAEGKAEALLAILAARQLPVSESQRQLIAATRDLELLDSWLVRVATCTGVDELLSARLIVE